MSGSVSRSRRVTVAAFVLSLIKDWLQDQGDGCDGNVLAPPRDASKFVCFSNCHSLRCATFLELSGCLARSFVVSSSEDEDQLLGHACSKCYIVGRTSSGLACFAITTTTPSS